jgi:hypothetical protein
LCVYNTDWYYQWDKKKDFLHTVVVNAAALFLFGVLVNRAEHWTIHTDHRLLAIGNLSI